MQSYIVFKYKDKSKKPIFATDNSRSALSWCYQYLKEHPRSMVYILIESTTQPAHYIDVMWANVEGKRKIIAHGKEAYTLNADGSRNRYLKEIFKVSKDKAGFAFVYR